MALICRTAEKTYRRSARIKGASQTDGAGAAHRLGTLTFVEQSYSATNMRRGLRQGHALGP
jgi:hypothetical protein